MASDEEKTPGRLDPQQMLADALDGSPFSKQQAVLEGLELEAKRTVIFDSMSDRELAECLYAFVYVKELPPTMKALMSSTMHRLRRSADTAITGEQIAKLPPRVDIDLSVYDKLLRKR